MPTKNDRTANTQALALIRRALASSTRDKSLSLQSAAANAGVSVRTLQRQLSAEGLSYRSLLDQVRLEKAIRLLVDPMKRVTDIAYELGYSDVAHFSRAFRRIAGVPPREYRRRMPGN